MHMVASAAQAQGYEGTGSGEPGSGGLRRVVQSAFGAGQQKGNIPMWARNQSNKTAENGAVGVYREADFSPQKAMSRNGDAVLLIANLHNPLLVICV